MTAKKEIDHSSRRNAIKLGLGAASIATFTSASLAEASTPKTPFTLTQIYIPIANSTEQFPVRRIYCIGRNYAAHAICLLYTSPSPRD
jgi:fumarylpyruvate hydrolase